MSPSTPLSPENQGLKLPPPVAEQATAPGSEVEVTPSSPETGGAAAAEVAPAIKAPPLATPPIQLPTDPVQPAPQTTADGNVQVQSVSPPIADDGDLIEKEWVNKAKRIVEKTREDPYQQSEELTEVKADYMKKRYNKTIKLNK